MRGSGLINAQTLLAAAGVAWGLYETWQGQQAQPAAAPAASGPLAVPPPLPGAASPAPPAEESGLPAPVLQLMRLMVSAARADGELGPRERERILAEAREVGAEALVLREIETPRPLGELVAGVTDPHFKEQLYTLAFTIVRADEAVTGGGAHLPRAARAPPLPGRGRGLPHRGGGRRPHRRGRRRARAERLITHGT